MGRHSFCAETRYCTRCGMPADWFTRHDVVVPCYPQSAPVVSLDWWKRLQAHEASTGVRLKPKRKKKRHLEKER